MDLPPVVHVGHKEGGDHPQGLHPLQLVQAQQLGVDHHRAAQLFARLPLRLGQEGQILLRRPVPVAVGQQLGVPVQGLPEGRQHLAVRHGGGPTAAPRIGLPHPGGAPLGGAVQKDLHARHLEAPRRGAHPLGKLSPEAVIVRRGDVGVHIQIQEPPPQNLPVHRGHYRLEQALLGGGDAVGGVLLLGPLKGPQHVLQALHGNPAQQVQEGVLLPPAGERPLPVPLQAAVPVQRPQPLQGQGVEHPRVAGGVLDDHRIVGTGPVQAEAVGGRPLRQGILVVAGALDPLPGLNPPLLNMPAQPVRDLSPTGALPQGHLEAGVGAGQQVAVGVQKGGQEGPSLQVHPSGPGTGQPLRLLPVPHIGDPSAPLHQGLGILGLLQGHNGPAKVKGGLHGSASCFICPDCITVPVYKQGPVGV